MDRLLEALRRNPDAIAIAVLCLLLGIGRNMPFEHAAGFHNPGPARLHWNWTQPAEPQTSADAPQWKWCMPGR